MTTTRHHVFLHHPHQAAESHYLVNTINCVHWSVSHPVQILTCSQLNQTYAKSATPLSNKQFHCFLYQMKSSAHDKDNNSPAPCNYRPAVHPQAGVLPPRDCHRTNSPAACCCCCHVNQFNTGCAAHHVHSRLRPVICLSPTMADNCRFQHSCLRHCNSPNAVAARLQP